ncbi:MAG: hypothetical protein KatS3mg102_0007 [Planctomycetota bacterium]|nr:MAG: hypothetical protein KatS3mg102_0007 [Planctomycetota bacterium]
MPTYDYRCEACEHRFERFQPITAEPVRSCPVCAGPVRRLIGPGAGFLFKGSGFYITDYRSASYTAAKKAESAGSTGGTGAGSGGSGGNGGCKGDGSCARSGSACAAS